MRRSIATCYSEHAVKVSDSYCSGPSSRPLYPITQTLNPSSIQNSVTCVYKSNLFLITLTWQKPLAPTIAPFTISLSLSADPQKSARNPNPRTPHQFPKIKGAAAFHSCSSKIEAFWDLSNAQFDSGPEPTTNFYLLILADSELILLLGDITIDEILAAKEKFRFINRISVADFALISRREYFSGSASFATKARFCDSAPAHRILIRCGKEEEGEEDGKWRNFPVLSVSIDERKVVRIKRLMWNFRGNQTIFVDGVLVDMMWDVHDWFFNVKGSGCAVFMFRTRSGLDSRLWLEESLAKQDQEKVGFSLLIYACKNPD